MEKELSARFGDQLEAEKAWGYFCKCVVINSKLKEYLIYLPNNIGSICSKEKSPL